MTLKCQKNLIYPDTIDGFVTSIQLPHIPEVPCKQGECEGVGSLLPINVSSLLGVNMNLNLNSHRIG